MAMPTVRRGRQARQFSTNQLALGKTEQRADRVVDLRDREVQPCQNDPNRIFFEQLSERFLTLAKRAFHQHVFSHIARNHHETLFAFTMTIKGGKSDVPKLQASAGPGSRLKSGAALRNL